MGSGGGLDELREQDNFWSWVEPPVFERFLATPDDVPVVRGLIDAFVASWSGPSGLGELAVAWRPIRFLYSDLETLLRVVYDLCKRLPASADFDAAAQAAFPRISERRPRPTSRAGGEYRHEQLGTHQYRRNAARGRYPT